MRLWESGLDLSFEILLVTSFLNAEETCITTVRYLCHSFFSSYRAVLILPYSVLLAYVGEIVTKIGFA